MVRLTPLGIDLMMAPNEEFRQKKLKDAAKKPRIFADLLKQWSPENLPSNQTIAHYLVTQKGFNPSGTEACIKNFRDTIKYAHISSSDILPSGDPQDGVNTEQASAIKVGALVQWESGGMLQFPEARRVTFISEDGLFVFVDGEKTGLPVGEVTVMETKQPATPVQPANPPPIPPTNVKGPRAFRQDVYTLGDEGQVILQTPETMGQESYEELMDWMDLQMRKIARLNKIKLPEKKS